MFLANDNELWSKLVDRLWNDKVYIAENIKKLRTEQRKSKDAFHLSLKDLERKFITIDELCVFQWNFRFKPSAGMHWTISDPWHQGHPPTKVKFNKDGTMIRRMGNETYMSHFFWKIEENGTRIRVNNFPPYVVRRYKNWGFVMESCWVLYTAFPMPPKGIDPELEIEQISISTQRRDALAYNLGPFHHLNDDQLADDEDFENQQEEEEEEEEVEEANNEDEVNQFIRLQQFINQLHNQQNQLQNQLQNQQNQSHNQTNQQNQSHDQTNNNNMENDEDEEEEMTDKEI